MPNEPDNLVRRHLRSMDAKLDRALLMLGNVEARLTAIEVRDQSTDIRLNGMQAHITEINARLDRIERRLELTEDA